MKDKLLYLTSPTIKKEGHGFWHLFGFWIQQITYLAMFLHPIDQVIWKASSFMGRLGHVNILQQLQAALQAALHLKHMILLTMWY